MKGGNGGGGNGGGGGICILQHWQLMEAICTGICHGNKLTRTPFFFCSHTSQSSNVGWSNNQMKKKSAYQILMVTHIGVLCKAV